MWQRAIKMEHIEKASRFQQVRKAKGGANKEEFG